MTHLSLKDAVAARNAISVEQQKRITALYEDWAKQMHMQAVKMDYKGKSAAFAQYNARYLEAQMKAYGQQVADEVKSGVQQSVFAVSSAVIDAGSQWLQKYGFTQEMVTQAFGNIPHETVQRLVTGQVYDGGWNLSKAIWSDNVKAQKDAYEIVAKGLAMNKPVYDIAKELEAYVSPSQRLSWSTATYEGKKIRIYKKAVDYNAQRLVRTLTQHSYMQTFTSFAQRNPFVTGVMWRANGSRACPICSDRDGIVFAPGKVPLDHPNGMCDLEIVYDEDKMQSQLADWVLSEDGKYPEIDKFAESMGFKPANTYAKLKSAEDKSAWMVKNKLGGQTASVPQTGLKWAKSLPQETQMELKQLKAQMAMTWDDFYAKFVFTGTPEEYLASNPKATGKLFKKLKPKAEPKPKKSGYQHVLDNLQSSYTTTNPLYADIEKKFGKEALAEVKDLLHEIKVIDGYKYHIDVWKAYYGRKLSAATLQKLDATFAKHGAKAAERAEKLKAAKAKAEAEAKKKAEALKQKLKQSGAKGVAPEPKTWQRMLDDNSRSWMHDNENANVQKITATEKSAIHTYTGSSYTWMNAMFESWPVEEFESPARLGKFLDSVKSKTFDVKTRYGEESRKATKVVDCYKGLEKCKLEEPLVIRRGTGKGEIGMLFGDYSTYGEASDAVKRMSVSEIKQKFVGEVGMNRQFESCSPISSGGFSGNTELVFYLHPGCEGSVAWTEMSAHSSELEFLLNAGHKMICRDVVRGGGQGADVRVFIEVLPK